jgi:late competence protein required for DNA uptake (superfamily II DNA/RNA helicase)
LAALAKLFSKSCRCALPGILFFAYETIASPSLRAILKKNLQSKKAPPLGAVSINRLKKVDAWQNEKMPVLLETHIDFSFTL